MRIKTLATGALAVMALGATALALGSPGTARAEHAHWLVTPGTCVEDLGSGQTSITDTEHGGYHRFHFNVHLGVPGAEAFANPNNPVSVGKGSCP
jgi:hypothetical protein